MSVGRGILPPIEADFFGGLTPGGKFNEEWRQKNRSDGVQRLWIQLSKAVCLLCGKGADLAAPEWAFPGGLVPQIVQWGFDSLRRGLGISRLRARPKGAALWKPAAFVKAGETFDCASRTPFETLIHI